jgi:hyperosmotically inducible periplasmic protein
MIFKKPFSTAVVVTLLSFSGLALAANKNDCKVGDMEIIKDVKYKLSTDKAVSASIIEVTSKDCMVTLTGNVKTGDEASRAIEIVTSTPGVIDVDTDNLTVNTSKHPFLDAYITAKVKGTFMREKIFGKESISMTGIHVETKNGVVYLTGTATAAETQNAVNLVKSINGVKGIELQINEMTVKDKSATSIKVTK